MPRECPLDHKVPLFWSDKITVIRLRLFLICRSVDSQYVDADHLFFGQHVAGADCAAGVPVHGLY